MRLYVIYSDEYGERVVGNLVNLSTFCQACDLACVNCRLVYGSYAADIHKVDKMPQNLPALVDDPEKYFSDKLPNCDLILAIALHPDLLAALPSVVERTNAKGVIVPIEDRNWCPPGLQRQIGKQLDIVTAFPKPFCSLEESGKSPIDNFIRRYQVGKPQLKIDAVGETIANVSVVRSAPCGSTWFVAQQMKGHEISEIEDVVSKAHHAYPCTASMEIDPELKDTILHKAGYIIREAVNDAVNDAIDEASSN